MPMATHLQIVMLLVLCLSVLSQASSFTKDTSLERATGQAERALAHFLSHADDSSDLERSTNVGSMMNSMSQYPMMANPMGGGMFPYFSSNMGNPTASMPEAEDYTCSDIIDVYFIKDEDADEASSASSSASAAAALSASSLEGSAKAEKAEEKAAPVDTVKTTQLEASTKPAPPAKAVEAGKTAQPSTASSKSNGKAAVAKFLANDQKQGRQAAPLDLEKGRMLAHQALNLEREEEERQVSMLYKQIDADFEKQKRHRSSKGAVAALLRKEKLQQPKPKPNLKLKQQRRQQARAALLRSIRQHPPAASFLDVGKQLWHEEVWFIPGDHSRAHELERNGKQLGHANGVRQLHTTALEKAGSQGDAEIPPDHQGLISDEYEIQSQCGLTSKDQSSAMSLERERRADTFIHKKCSVKAQKCFCCIYNAMSRKFLEKREVSFRRVNIVKHQ